MTATAEHRVFVGTLKADGPRPHRFRVRDDVGNVVTLRGVEDKVEAAQFVGGRVRAEGVAVPDGARVTELLDVTVQPAGDPLSLAGAGSPVPLATILASALGPDPDGGMELTDEEFEVFLHAAKGHA